MGYIGTVALLSWLIVVVASLWRITTVLVDAWCER